MSDPNDTTRTTAEKIRMMKRWSWWAVLALFLLGGLTATVQVHK